MQWKITQNARAQPGLMQVLPRRWKTLRLRLDFKLKAVGLLKLRSASLSLLPGTPSDFDAHVMWRRQHALHLGFTVCPTYRPFNTVGEKTGGKWDKLHGIYVAGNYTDTAKAKPWHTHTHLPFVFRVHHNGCDCRNRMQMSTGVSRNVFSRRRAVGVRSGLTELYIMFIYLINGAWEVHFSFPFRISSLKHNNLLPPVLNWFIIHNSAAINFRDK